MLHDAEVMRGTDVTVVVCVCVAVWDRVRQIVDVDLVM